jgi:polar amino acid transport system substrate-binding protein
MLRAAISKLSARRRGARLAAAGAAVLLALPAAASGAVPNGIKLVNPGHLTICTHLSYKPFEYINKDGKVVGFDVDMLDLLAKRLGVKTRIISIDWNQVTSGAVFAANRCDVAMGAETITPERAKPVLFSDPYFDATQVLLAKKGSGVHGLASLKGKRFGVQVNTTGQIYADKRAAKFGYTTVIFPDLIAEASAVSVGAVAAAINDNGPMYEYARTHPDTHVVAEFDTGEHYGFAFKKNSANATRLAGVLNTVLAKAKSDGEYNKIFKTWFGQIPQDVKQ